MPLAQGKIVGVVRRCDLHRAGTELAAHPAVGHDGDLPSGQGQAQLLPCRCCIALIVGMNGNGDVAQHGLGPRGRDE